MSAYFAELLGRALDVPGLVFEAPEALRLLWVAVPLGLAALLRWRDFGALRLLVALLARTALVLALALTLARPVAIDRQGSASSVLLLDTSPSLSRHRLEATRALAASLLAGAGKAQVDILSFAEGVRPIVPATLDAPLDRAPGRGTDLAGALRAAYPLLTPGSRRSVVLLSDGNQTSGDLLAEADRAAALGITLYAALPGRAGAEVRVVEVEAPETVRAGAEATVVAHLEARYARRARVSLWRGKDKLAEQQVALTRGRNAIPFPISPERAGIEDYRVQVRAAGDAQRANDTYPARVRVTPRPLVLVLAASAEAAQTVARLVDGPDLEVEPGPVARLPGSLAELSGYDAVVLNDLGAEDLGEPEVERLGKYLGDLAGGVLWIGGARAKDLSAPEDAPIEPLLPLEFERRKRREKLTVAMVLVIDRSGSMARDGKFEAAIKAADAAVGELKKEARVALLLFDDFPSLALPLTPAAERERIRQIFGALEVGGGTSIYPALDEAYALLEPVEAKVRHVLLLSDGESVSRYEHHLALLEKFSEKGMTISTVALGPDADREHLRRLAGAGGGRFYYAPTPDRVPRIFTRETRTMSETGAVERKVRARPVKPSDVLEGLDLPAAGVLTGLLSSRVKPTAELLAESTKDEPLLARWRYGLGQVLACATDAAGPWTEQWRAWPDLGRFWQRLARGVLRRQQVAGLAVETRPVGSEVEVTVVARDRAGKPLDPAAIRLTALGPDLTPTPLELTRGGVSALVARHQPAAPGAYLFRAEHLEEGRPIEVATARLVEAYPDEFAAAGDDRALLAAACARTGGRLDAAPAEIFAEGPPVETKTPHWQALVYLALALFLLEAAARRL